MRNNTIPKTIQKWLDANTDKIHKYYMEYDGFGESEGHPYSIWVELKAGWINDSLEAHLIHECTVKDFMAHAAEVIQCNCEQCQYEIAENKMQ